MKPHQLVEILGLILVLLSTGAQLFSDDLNTLILRADLYRLDYKLNLLWRFTNEINQSDNESPQARFNKINDIALNWYKLEQSTSQAEDQGFAFTIAFAILFSLGSFLLIVGRYFEHKHKIQLKS